MASILTKIRKRAEQIRRQHPEKKYQTALKEAGREYRSAKIGKVKKKAKKKARYVPVKVKHSRTVGAVPGQTLAQTKLLYKRQLEAELGWLLLGRDQAVGITNKRKYNQKIVDVRRRLRAVQ